MSSRFLAIWFPHLKTDWFTNRQPELARMPFVLVSPDHGRMVITAANFPAQEQGIHSGMAAADARAILPSLKVMDDPPDLSDKLLKGLAEWSVRYSPVVSMDTPDGLLLDITGCAHLWSGEESYLQQVLLRFKSLGYQLRGAIADTVGCAWAVARFSNGSPIIGTGKQADALLALPPAALRLEPLMLERLQKLGLYKLGSFIAMPRPVLKRRFGQQLIQRLDKALGNEEETLSPVHPPEPYQERLPCLEPVQTAGGIAMALQELLEKICLRLQKEQKGLRKAVFNCYRIDGKLEKIEIGTNRPSSHVQHLFRLFEPRMDTIEPALGIELFTLQAPKVEDLIPFQEKLWSSNGGLEDMAIAELVDRIANRIGAQHINRYLPEAHYWPERSIKPAASVHERPAISWPHNRTRPLQLLPKPELIEVAAPIPDYPPMLFRYKGKLHTIKKADGPERIEPEWWLEEGEHRDYYSVEDQDGARYWVFRSGHYSEDKLYKWFIHGFFA